ncbi:MAG: type I restriction endonuclease subunit R [Candidatus Delongbacteria bacterium]|jgi:type I restriction enzyme R subunit|nr:type I restriction endonuclease subunit R [Candidatus Delongbacteria bacterium]
MPKFQFNEKFLSQIPAIELLINLGYEYISPSKALFERQDRKSNVLLENILRNQLKEINRINFKGNEYLFSEENIQSAIQKIKNIKYDGLLKTNEAIYDLLTLGTALEQSVDGDLKSFDLNYIDWRNPERNIYHVTPEYSVERSRSTETARPDLVLFVNGIPFTVIECKSPSEEVEQAVSQTVRNQGEDFIPKLFVYTQMVLATNKNKALYATAGTSAKFWGVWKEPNMNVVDDEYKKLQKIINDKIDDSVIDELSRYFKVNTSLINQERLVTEQDKAIYSLCRPERLLELVWKYVVFDGGDKKIARYQQYFVIKSTLDRIKNIGSEGKRQGGIIWHTQGSGKSLTMVMLARNLAIDTKITNPRLVLVTDRTDLDKQLKNTFVSCRLEPRRATSGRNLVDLIIEKNASIITTLIHKFERASTYKQFHDDSPDIFILVDESHRSQFGTHAAKMRKMFPNACYIGFTGTPLLKKEKNSFQKFGGLIDPHYSITQAVEDKAVVPLLYEGRLVELKQNKVAIDLWFERHTQGLTEDQKADLKRKYSRAEMLNKTDQVIYMRAFDISEHFRENWKGTGFKAQLVAPGKESALKYYEYLNEIGVVTSEVIISPPDSREGYEEVDDEPKEEVQKFWQKMMKRYGNEDNYNRTIIDQFKKHSNPEILIVVDKLLTGFDATRNTVMYLCRILREHNLLQAIARVNRLHEGKQFGYIVDYANILGELDKALTQYDALEGFDITDLEGTLISINKEIEKLPQKYSDLWDVFKTVKYANDEESYEKLLADDSIREEFYERLRDFGRILAIALSSDKFLTEIDEKTLQRYKNDYKKFEQLRKSVKQRYGETISYKDYEPKIKKLLDTHIQAYEVTQLNEPVNIFDDVQFQGVKEEQGVYGKTTASKADSIAHAIKKVTTEKMDEDPAFYEKFSKLIQEVIDLFRSQRITETEYLDRAIEIRNKIKNRVHDDIPEILTANEDAAAYYGVIKPLFDNIENTEDIIAKTAIEIQKILINHKKVHFWDDEDEQKQAMNEIDDYLYDIVKQEKGIELTVEQMDEIIEKALQVARHRSN